MAASITQPVEMQLNGLAGGVGSNSKEILNVIIALSSSCNSLRFPAQGALRKEFLSLTIIWGNAGGRLMDGAEQLRIEPVRFAAADANSEAPLDLSANPFSASAAGTRLGRSLQTALGEVIRHIELQAPVVVVLGAAGTGKTLLTDMVARACSGMSISVRRAESGHLLEQMIGQSSDVLLVDEADSVPSTVLQACLAAPANSVARTIVFLCLPSCVTRFSFSGSDAALVELGAMSVSDARAYLDEGGNSVGRCDLFDTEAAGVLIDSSRGVPRLLRSIASLAYFTAASEGAAQILCAHVESALRIRGEFGQAVSSPNAQPPAMSAAVEETQAAATSPEPLAIEPKPQARAARTTPPRRTVPVAEKLWRPEAVRRSRRQLHLSLSGVALGICLLTGGIIGTGIFHRSDSHASEVTAAGEESRVQKTDKTAPIKEPNAPRETALGGDAPKLARPKNQPAFLTTVGLARGNVQEIPSKAGIPAASSPLPAEDTSLEPVPTKAPPERPGKVVRSLELPLQTPVALNMAEAPSQGRRAPVSGSTGTAGSGD